ncbi:cell envelope integrity protein TolA [Pontibacterium granulatum]|uniref:cell envelope integrity protein TolA n=1 Tax=Pontibacterium granulatum TaxID=2036029 RepID=UPI003CE54DFF
MQEGVKRNYLLSLTCVLLLVTAGFSGASSLNEKKYQRCTELWSCSSSVQQTISHNWVRPQSAVNGMKVKLAIRLTTEAQLEDVYIVESSGSYEFDVSAINAVRNSAPFPVLLGLPVEDFNKYFRRFTINFEPHDLRQ